MLVQTMEALAIVLQEPSIRRRFSAVICFVAKVRARVTVSGRPSGMVMMTSIMEMINFARNQEPRSGCSDGQQDLERNEC